MRGVRFLCGASFVRLAHFPHPPSRVANKHLLILMELVLHRTNNINCIRGHLNSLRAVFRCNARPDRSLEATVIEYSCKVLFGSQFPWIHDGKS